MSNTIIEQLADFSAGTQFHKLPPEVIEESKRDILDLMGVALAAIDQPKGRAGIECARRMSGSNGNATIIGTGYMSTVFGAAFANGELINMLDMDSVLSTRPRQPVRPSRCICGGRDPTLYPAKTSSPPSPFLTKCPIASVRQ